MTTKEILIIEDDPKFRNSVKFALREKGYTFFEAASIQQGLNQLHQNPHIKVILLDLNFKGGGSGKDFLEQIKEESYKYKIIVLTGYENILEAGLARKYAVFNYLPKAQKLSIESIKFTITQAFNELEREQLKDKNVLLVEIQNKINKEIKESSSTEETIKALNDILTLICQSVNNLVGTYKCHIRLYNLNRGDFDLAGFAGPSDDVRRIFDDPSRKGEHFSGIVAEKKAPILFEDLQNDDEFKNFKKRLLEDNSLPDGALKYLDTVQSAYIVPITTQMFDDETDAVFNVSSDSTKFFSEEKQTIIHEFVTQATIAITKAWQKKKKSESHQDYKEISAVLEQISKQLRGEDVKNKIYDIAIDGISKIIKPETISIYLYNKATKLLNNEAEFRGNERVEPRKVGHSIKEGLTGWVFTECKPIRIPNLQMNERRPPQHHPQYLAHLETDYIDKIPSERVDHYLGVPMVIGNEPIGAIQLLNKKSDYHKNPEVNKERWLLERGFSNDCENVLLIAASHLAVAIKNAELLEEQDKKINQLKTLNEVGRFTSSELPLDQLLKTIIQQAADVMRAEICLLFLKDEDESKNRILLKQSYGIPISILQDAFYQIGENLTGKVAQNGESKLLEKVKSSNGKYDDKILHFLCKQPRGTQSINSLIIVPIVAKGKILGCIKVINKLDKNFQYRKEDVTFLEAFAGYIGVAIENARVYEETFRKLAIAEGLSQLVRGVAHEINNTSGLIPFHAQKVGTEISTLLNPVPSINRKATPKLLKIERSIGKSLNIIDDAATQAVDFAKELLGFSAKRIGTKKRLNINILLAKAITETPPEFKKNKEIRIKIIKQLSKEELICEVFENPFIQIARNIIINAYQAMEEKKQGTLTIKTHKDIDKGTARIEFIDTGCGIKPEHLSKIFNPDFTTKKRGNGLGMWLTKTFLDRMDGTIRVSSVFNKETNVIIELPVFNNIGG
jgi:signal transduction histidine kinase/ActR/RegA family two-component response regulator